MPSTYSTRLRLELQATGENQVTWGDKANAVFSRLDDAIAGVVSINLGTSTSSSYTLSAANGAYDEARGSTLRIYGQLASSIPLVLPAVEKNYWIYNGTSGSTPRVGPTGGNTVSLQAGWSKVITDGSAIWLAVEPLSLTTYLSDSSASLKYAQLSANQSLTGGNTFTSAATFTGTISATSAVTFTGPLSVSSLNATAKLSAGSLFAVTISTTNLVAVSISADNVAGTNAYFTSVSASAVYARAMYIAGSVVLTSALLPSSGSGVQTVSVSNYGGYSELIIGTSVSGTNVEIKTRTIRAYSSTSATINQQLGDVSIVVTQTGNVIEIQLVKRLYDPGGGA